MIVAMENVVLPQQTRKRGFRYEITAKHHGENRRAAMWLPEVTPAEEFAIFGRSRFRGYIRRSWVAVWRATRGSRGTGTQFGPSKFRGRAGRKNRRSSGLPKKCSTGCGKQA